MKQSQSKASIESWSVVLGWLGLGLLNVLFVDLLHRPVTGLWGIRLLHHAIDLGRHLGFGLLFFVLFELSRGRMWMWLASIWLLALAFGIWLLPEDLAGVSQRLSAQLGLPASASMAALILLVVTCVPLAAALARTMSRGLFRVGALLVAAAIYTANNTISPHDNSGGHFFLALCNALLLGAGLSGLVRPMALRMSSSTRARRLIFAGSAGWASWALWAPHASAVRVDLAAWPGGLLVEQLSFGDDLDVDDIRIDHLGPFFRPRNNQTSVPPTQAFELEPEAIVVLLTIDGLRADVLADPRHRPSMPTLAKLSDEGTMFVEARAPGSQTVVTLATLSTATYFSQQYWTARKAGEALWLHEDRHTHFPALLSAAGVRTVIVPSAEWMGPTFGVLRGFAEHTYKRGRGRWNNGQEVTDRLLSVLRAHRSGPLFLFAHYLDSHAPYAKGKPGEKPFDRYLRSLSQVDRHLAKLVAELRRLRAKRPVLLVISSDHGEAFGEHATQYHATTLYEELLRVPLVFHGTGVRARRVDEPVSLVDLGPTFLDMYGLATPGTFMGQSLAPLLAGKSFPYQRPIVAEGRLKQAMVFDDGLKVIVDRPRKTVEIYDLERDSAENHNLVQQDSHDGKLRLAMLLAFFREHTLRRAGYTPPLRK